jgi:hypothetical protein
LLLELDGADIAQCRVPSPRVVEALDVIEHIRPGIIPRPVDLAGYALGFQRREEALHCSIVPDVTRPAHRTGDAMIGHQALELLARILAALVAVMQQAVWPASSPDCKPQVAHGWISMCAEVPHNLQFQRIQTVIHRRLDSNLRSALREAGVSDEDCANAANTVSLLIDGLWLRCGLQIGGLDRDDAIAQIEAVVTERFGDNAERNAARQKMRMLAAAMTTGKPT